MPTEKCLFYDYTQKLSKNMLEAVRATSKVFEQQKKTRIPTDSSLVVSYRRSDRAPDLPPCVPPKGQIQAFGFPRSKFLRGIAADFLLMPCAVPAFLFFNLCLEMRIMFLLFYCFNKGEYYLYFQILKVRTLAREVLN